MTVYTLSDSHLFHSNILKHCNRPFNTVEAMNNYILNSWRRTVNHGDTLLHLGDVLIGESVADTEKKLKAIIPQLPGVKVLLRGNHDLSKEKMLSVGFDEVHDFLFVNHLGFNIGLAHKPNNTELQKHIKKGNIGLHGHIHQHPSPLDNLINMSVERWGYEVVSMDEVLEPLSI